MRILVFAGLGLIAAANLGKFGLRFVSVYKLRKAAKDLEEHGKFGVSYPGKFLENMTVPEALLILNMKNNPKTQSEILVAYHRLMKYNHPDIGGSVYLSKKINEAKDLLIITI